MNKAIKMTRQPRTGHSESTKRERSPFRNRRYALRSLGEGDGSSFLSIRKEALRRDRAAFGSSLLEEFDLSSAEVAEMLREDDHNSLLIGALSRGESLVGVIGLKREHGLRFRHKAVMWGLYVRPKWRKHGVGRLLVDEALSIARQMNGIKAVKLSVNAEQIAAIRLYLSAGFGIVGVEPDALYVHGRYFHGIHMERRC